MRKKGKTIRSVQTEKRTCYIIYSLIWYSTDSTGQIDDKTEGKPNRVIYYLRDSKDNNFMWKGKCKFFNKLLPSLRDKNPI